LADLPRGVALPLTVVLPRIFFSPKNRLGVMLRCVFLRMNADPPYSEDCAYLGRPRPFAIFSRSKPQRRRILTPISPYGFHHHAGATIESNDIQHGA